MKKNKILFDICKKKDRKVTFETNYLKNGHI